MDDVTGSRTRRRLIALGATAGALGLLGGSLGYGARELLHRQAAAARRVIGKPHGEQAPHADRVWKKKYAGSGSPDSPDSSGSSVPLELLLLGDSMAAGLGADRPKDTLGGRLAKGLAKQLERPVRLTTGAIVGSESSALAGQIAALSPTYAADVAVIVVGGNDVTHRVPVADSVRQLQEAVRELRERGTSVVVGTCPDLGALVAVPQPLRTLGSRASRQLAAAQAVGAVEAGAHAVSLAHVVGPFFTTNPDEMFSLDRFHPSALGYRRTASALMPSVLTALGLREEVPFGHHAPGPPTEGDGGGVPSSVRV